MFSYRRSSSGLSVAEKAYIAALLGLVAAGVIKLGAKLGSNRDNVDFEKSFNYYVDYNGKGTSMSKVMHYSDYNGETVEFTTEDGLQVLTGLRNSEIMFVNSYKEAYERALELTGNHPENIISYDISQGLDPEVYGEKVWNKNFFNLNYDFDYAVVENENGVTLVNIQSWRDWDSDDKIQFIDADGNVYLTTYGNAKLINSENVTEKAVYDYVLSLAGFEDRLYDDVDIENKTAKKLVRSLD